MQTARGASLSSSADQSYRRIGLFFGIALVVYAIDQTTKISAVARLEDQPAIGVVPGVFELSFLRNPGAAFGMGASITPVLTVLMIVIAVGVLVAAALTRHTGWAVALGLLFGGATGNITDRMLREPGVFRGEVVDFLSLSYWPMFNVADMAITCAAVLILVLSWRGIDLTGPRAARD